ncbi:MAG: class I SAM-dependent methyltransferase [Brevundimonas sp.]|nr:class I SAM-dependent methyltransferase [Brevundimonas sp.]
MHGVQSRPHAPSEQTRTLIRACPLCGEDNQSLPRLRVSPEAWPMKACPRCGMVYLERAPEVSELFVNFAWEKQREAENQRRHEGLSRVEVRARKAWRGFRPLPRKNAVAMVERLAAPGQVVDVGCGNGKQLAELSAGFMPLGIEISEALAAEARARLDHRGGRIVNADALSGLRRLSPNSFSAIIMRSFLEHDIQPRLTLEACQAALAPDGVAVIKVPNYASLNRRVTGARWCGLRFPDHVNYFTPKTLSRFVTEAGLEIEEFGPTFRLPTSDNMWMVARKPVRHG